MVLIGLKETELLLKKLILSKITVKIKRVIELDGEIEEDHNELNF